MTPLVGAESGEIDGTCVAVSDAISITTQVFRQPDFEKAIEAYLNAGGSISRLPDALVSTDRERPIRMQIVGEDVTGNEIPDVLMGITLPYAEGDGETHLLFFTCIEGQYQGKVLFRRAGAGSRMEGLYAGGGATIEHVGDLNGNGRAEVFYSVSWPGYAEYFLAEWNGKQFVSLIEYENLLGDTCYWIEAFAEEVEIVDVEGDGLFEIVVSEQVGDVEGEETVIWRWNGELYDRDRE